MMKQYNTTFTLFFMLFVFTTLLTVSSVLYANEYELDFGVVLHNDVGEPVGFQKTTQIPIENNGQASLYGLVVTSAEDKQFSLNSVHVLPTVTKELMAEKIIGKDMFIQKRGAIFMRTDLKDQPGLYKIEVYIDNKLYEVIQYELVPLELAQVN